MSRQPFAQVAETHLVVRKGLFVLLAALLTLVVCQQFLYWTQAPEPLIHMNHATAAPRMTEASAQAGQLHGRLFAVESVDQVERSPHEPRWVF
ncbi:hypothetical protein [Pseudomonas typographi]|uniref:Uncharacterized protein n=1 Tax=Pseudomonas typographi TaxID=2715964 RepID=A0ABR7Z4J2_9PSED|nr:hypothetical protein [Pseudomonas typographi]MBD1552968.1 hypothetical protein [Pseudomonas typographi]MBD1588343.1 hypothetical protein [Pseudomonas typographi]MBD1600314.1 hypothetical protein [Pseudomonas typographi]